MKRRVAYLKMRNYRSFQPQLRPNLEGGMGRVRACERMLCGGLVMFIWGGWTAAQALMAFDWAKARSGV